MDERPVNILCLKWGKRYPAAFTNILHASVRRHLRRPFRFVCLTDDPAGLAPGIEPFPLPECPDPEPFGPWAWPNIFVKLCLYKPGLADLRGPTLFFDVDVSIQGDLDCFFDYEPGKFCIIHNWVERRKYLFRRPPDIGNSSLFRFDAGSPQAAAVYEAFLRELPQAIDRRLYTTEQAYMTHAMTLAAGELPRWWPDPWVKSFKRTCVPPFPLNLFVTPKKPDTKILVFHGNPDPDVAARGFRAKRLHNSVRPCPWILQDWHE